ncbi:MAG: hypothetical protein JXA33_21075 [Anaerolineae bacterium]|nr:hypothetical protein [Anaerolineae bacterium]
MSAQIVLENQSLQNSDNRQRSPWWVDVIVIILYSVLTIVMTYPLILRLNSDFAGQNIDVWINPWATWWTEKALTSGQDLYYTNMLFYPDGVSLVFHSFSHINSAIAVLLRPWLGNLGAHNATVLLAHMLSGYAMFCLTRYITSSPIASFLSGLIFAFYPYRMAESVHPVLYSTQWMPLYLLSLIRLIKEKHKPNILFAALFFCLTALSSLHLMIFTTFMTGLYFCYLILFERQHITRTTLIHLAIMISLTGLLLSPYLYPLVKEFLSTPHTGIGIDLEGGQGNDLIAFFLPAEQHPIFGQFTTSIHAKIKNVRAAYIGITVMILSVVGALKNWKHARFWILLTLTSVLLSLHPDVQVAGQHLGIMLPWSNPIVGLLHNPFRFNLLIGLALAVTGGLGFSYLLKIFRQRYAIWVWPLTIGTMGILLFEYLYLPFPTTPAIVPDYYRQIATTPGKGAILELPMGHYPHYYLFYQMTHNRPLVEGHVSRTPDRAYTFIETTPVLRSIYDCGNRILPPADLTPHFEELANRGIEYIILHKHLVSTSGLSLWKKMRTVTPIYEDQDLAVYRTAVISATLPLTSPQLLEKCIAIRSPASPTYNVTPGQPIEVPLEWIVGNPPQKNYSLELALLDETHTVRRRQWYDIVTGASIIGWQTGKQYVTDYPFLVDDLLPAGTYHLQATLLPERRKDKSLLSAKLFPVDVQPASSSLPTNIYNQAPNADYEDKLRLLNYEIETNPNTFHLRLYWQASQKLDADYKFFIHLYNTENETVAGQIDRAPQNWTYPTPMWEPGNVVIDEVTFSLHTLPSGSYQLRIGVYDAYTEERLSITQHTSQFTSQNGQLILPEKIIR